MRPLTRRIWTLIGVSLLLFLFSTPVLFAQSVTVTSADPNNGPQGSVNLNVLVNGSGFKKGAIAKWFVSGTTDPGGLTVNSTAFINSSQLNANINISSTSPATGFDIVVTNSNGSSGKGTKLFLVTVPDPAIAYLSGGSLMVMNADGTNQLTVYHPPSGACVRRPDWSPDHSQLVFEMGTYCSAGIGGIYVINKDGTGLSKVVGLNNAVGQSWPVWSPAPAADGKWKIAFSDQVAPCSANNLFLVNLDGSGLTNLTRTCSTTQYSQYWPTWDSTATRLGIQVYPCVVNGGCTSHLYVYNLGLVNGVVGITGSTDLTASGGTMGGLWVFAPEWARTKDEIVFQGHPISNFNDSAIWIVSLANPANPVELTATFNTGTGWPSWAPDDSKIVLRYVPSTKQPGADVYVINSDGSGLSKLADGDQPRWRRCCPTCAIACAP